MPKSAAQRVTLHNGLADDRVLRISEFAEIAGISTVTLRRRIAANDGPIVTRLSKRRIGIRVRHARAWLDARARF
jgi:predicted DNA-binding transcriptional regulator AlpA